MVIEITVNLCPTCKTSFSGGEQFWHRGNIVGAPPAVQRDLLEVIGRHTNENLLDR